MYYRTLVLAFAATSSAQADLSEVISVLATALPTSLIAEYITNSAAVASEISSAFDAGNTPSWFEALPTDVQTYLIPAVETESAANFTTTQTSISGAPTIFANTTGNSTLATTRRTPSTSRTSSADSETTDSSSSEPSSTGDSNSDSNNSGASSEGGASMPTTIVGLGLAGAAGLVGLFVM